jgi:hypothetical protein
MFKEHLCLIKIIIFSHLRYKIKQIKMDNNLYAKVDFETTNNHGWSNVRGYGVLQMSKPEQYKIVNDKHMYNRIQPLTGPFANHFPAQENPDMVLQLNPQTDLAWATNNKN